MSLNKFTHIPLLKNDAKLKKKMTNNHTKKSNHPNFFIKIKNMFQKKSHPIKIKINYHTQALKNQKKKKLKKRGNVNAKKKKVTIGNVIALKKKKKKKKEAKKRGYIIGNVFAPKRGGGTLLPREERRKKMQLKLRVFM